MGRVDEGFVGKLQKFVVERVVKVGAEVVGTPPKRGAQVRAAHVTYEERAARENSVRLRRVLADIENQDRDRLDGVARSLQHLQAQSREVKGISVFHGGESVFRLGAGAEMDGRAAPGAQLQVAGVEVGVEVGEKDVADL